MCLQNSIQPSPHSSSSLSSQALSQIYDVFVTIVTYICI